MVMFFFAVDIVVCNIWNVHTQPKQNKKNNTIYKNLYKKKQTNTRVCNTHCVPICATLWWELMPYGY